MAEEKECERCSRTFSRPMGEHRVSDILWAMRRFCSSECAAAAYSEEAQAARPTKLCAICGAEFSAPASRLKRLVTCGKAECKKAYRKQIQGPKISARMVADYASGKRQPRR